ncbi:DNA repair and recombination protein RAD52 [Beauveria bassiana D1-5]|uniref:RAD52 homolog n=1 Tax=Beauveria bassiana D1-5 TaxID=1245745 RepID=A0A0A2VP85_BEABA|nr:DNA repair and recombination protein RAD52 [Beauveria bassiana D1-5]
MPGVKRKRSRSPSPEAEDVLHVSAVRQQQDLESVLRRGLGPEYVSTRTGPGNTVLAYLSSFHAVKLANAFFGPSGWSTEVRDVDKTLYQDSSSCWICDVICKVKVTVHWPNGKVSSHEDIGTGGGKPMKKRSEAEHDAVKAAVTDGKKRGLRMFGNALGNCLYSKSYVKKVLPLARRGPATSGAEWCDEELLHGSWMTGDLPRNGKVQARLPFSPVSGEVSNGAGKARGMSRVDVVDLDADEFEDDYVDDM